MKTVFTFLLAFVSFAAFGQTAKVQIIHNSPSPTVDIWVNGDKFLPDFEFRTATPFVEVPAGVELELGVAPAPSNDPSEILATFPVTLETDEQYVVIANGIVGDPNTPFNLEIISGAKQVSNDLANVDLAVFHGSPDAPAVDVYARDVAQLVDSAAFADATPYLEIPEGRYILDITADGSTDIVASYEANLTGLAGNAGVVFASGFLNPGMNQPAFGLFVALPSGGVVELPTISVASLQIVHNSPSPVVDIWVNGDKILSNFNYRSATDFFEVPAGVELNVGVAPAPSNDPSEIIAEFPVTLENGEKYIAIANGIVGDPNTPFNLEVVTPAKIASGDPGLVDLAVFHGSPDAPAVDVYARDAAQLVDGLAFAESTDYLSVPEDSYILDITAAGSSDIVASYFADLNGLGGGAGLVFASGFLNPGMNQPAFGLFVVLPNGTVVELTSVEVASLQIVHNSPSPTVDIWVNNQKLISNFEYRTATAFFDAPAGVQLEIGVAPAPSNDPSEIIATFPVTLENGEKYIAVANGVVGDPNTPFNIEVITPAQFEAVQPSNFDAVIFHGSPDAPAVDVNARGVGQLASNLAFGENSGYLEVPAGNYLLDITAAGSPDPVVSYIAPLNNLAGAAGLIMASGFLAPTDPGQPGFSLLVVFPNGFIAELPKYETADLQIVHNSPSPTVDIWINGEKALEAVAFRTATPFLEAPAGVPLEIGVAPSPSNDPSEIIATFDVTLEDGGTYIAIANGVVGDPNTPFNLEVIADARTEATDPGNVDLVVFHGSPDAPEVDVLANGGTPPLVDNLAFAESTDYISVPAGSYDLSITPADDNSNILLTYRADVSSLAGGAGMVFASGFLSDMPGFGLWVALPDGTVFPLPLVSSTREQDLNAEVNIFPNPVADWMSVSTTLEQSSDFMRYNLFDATGRMVRTYERTGTGLIHNERIDLGDLDNGYYILQVQNDRNEVSSFPVLIQK